MSSRRLDARFEAFDGHRSVVVRWQPPAAPRARALFVPAFGDEMNQMRRMVKLAAEALTERGVASCTFDLYGTGDSSADFADATVERWLADCRAMVERLDVPEPTPLALIGCRLGAALAARVSHELPRKPAVLVAWAPVLQGRQQLSAMLRAASIARLQRPEDISPDPKALWAQGRVAMLAGYPVSHELAEQLEALDATAPPAVASAVLFDLRAPVGGEAVTASEAMAKRAAAWTGQGVPTVARAVAGPAFWNVADLVDVPELVDATVDAVTAAIGATLPGAGP
ncbi:MAG: alpha/beta hydrolase [Burkholderiaceae bacterium]